MEVFSFSARGVRENNEDFILSHQLSSDCRLFIVADGMGGYDYGEIASSLACETILTYFISNYGKYDIKQLFSHAVSAANKKINEEQHELDAIMGTALAGVLIEGNKGYLFWLGDVRIYHFRNTEILFQSEDHSLINEMKKLRDVSANEIERYGHIITRSLTGMLMEEELEIFEFPLLSGDVLILCTDGFWQNVNVPSIINLSAKEIQMQLMKNEYDMDDNYSLLKINF